MHWGHAVRYEAIQLIKAGDNYVVHVRSEDLAHWKQMPIALYPDQPYDKDGVFSGSISVINGVPTIYYTCVGPKGQLQCIATPSNMSDPYLTEWTKSLSNPIILTSPPHGNTEFRDPTDIWQAAGTSHMAFAAELNGAESPTYGNFSGYSIVSYTSHDNVSWDYAGVMYHAPLNFSGQYECPDFWPVDINHGLWALKLSARRQDFVGVGQYSPSEEVWTPVTSMALYDYGQWYASKRFYDPPKGRNLLWGWVTEEDDQAVQRGWSGVQSLPRRLTYDPHLGIVLAAPAAEVAKLRTKQLVSGTDLKLTSGKPVLLHGAGGQQLDIMVAFAMPPLDKVRPLLNSHHGTLRRFHVCRGRISPSLEAHLH